MFFDGKSPRIACLRRQIWAKGNSNEEDLREAGAVEARAADERRRGAVEHQDLTPALSHWVKQARLLAGRGGGIHEKYLPKAGADQAREAVERDRHRFAVGHQVSAGADPLGGQKPPGA